MAEKKKLPQMGNVRVYILVELVSKRTNLECALPEEEEEDMAEALWGWGHPLDPLPERVRGVAERGRGGAPPPKGARVLRVGTPRTALSLLEPLSAGEELGARQTQRRLVGGGVAPPPPRGGIDRSLTPAVSAERRRLRSVPPVGRRGASDPPRSGVPALGGGTCCCGGGQRAEAADELVKVAERARRRLDQKGNAGGVYVGRMGSVTCGGRRGV